MKHIIYNVMKNYRKLMYVLFLLPALAVSAQCRYCMSFEDFMEGRWEPLDTVFVDSHSKSHQFWVGGGEVALTTGDKKTDKILKNESFAVKVGRKLFVNSHNLRYKKMKIGNGYYQAMTLGQHGIVFVNRTILAPKEMMERGAFYAGAIGAMVISNELFKQQVCYLISDGADTKKHINISMIDEKMMNNLLGENAEAIEEYYSETDPSKRLLAAHILPVLKKLGLLTKVEK